MAFDYKKEYKEFYMPKNKPQIITIPKMNFVAVRGCGDPNEEGGFYKEAINLLYGIAFTIKMSKKGEHQIDGYFDYVVPPLEGFWWQEGVIGVDYSRKDQFNWIKEKNDVANIVNQRKCAILDWQNEKMHQEKILEDGTESKEVLEYAKARIKEAEQWIAMIEKEMGEEYDTNCGGIQPSVLGLNPDQ